MENNVEKPNSNGSNRSLKIPLEELEKDELVKRCKNFIAIAQKAKLAKDDAQQRENDLIATISTLEEKVLSLEKEKASHHVRAEGAVTDKANLASQLADVTSELKKKEEDNDMLSLEIKSLQTKLDNSEENYSKQKEGFVEELNKMNVVLKQRGESITRLEEKCQSNEKEFKEKIETLLQSVAERERKIEQLENDVNRLETQSEAMSTSTVSRAEEIHRMKDVEDSLEDRYNKLKMLAVRMKKKMAEQSAQLIEQEKKLGSKANGEGLSNNRNNSTPLNLQAMQKDIDRLNDDLDSKKAEMKILKKDCDDALQELANSRQKAEEFKNEVSVLKSKETELEKANKFLEKSVIELKEQFDLSVKEHETDKILRLELSKECDRLKDEIKQLNGTIDELHRSQEVVKNETKKQNMLQLEITDYEKSLDELNEKVDLLQKEIKEKQSMIDRNDEEKEALQAQIKLLDQQLNTEQQRVTESKAALISIQSQLETCQNENEKQKMNLHSLTVKSESNGSEMESLRLQLSVANGELQKVKTGSTQQIESLRKQLRVLEETTAMERETKEKLQRDLSELQSEFEAYKRRATSLLKKQTETSSCNGTTVASKTDEFNTDQVEREMLQRVVEALKSKITELESQLTLSQSELSNMRIERERTATTHMNAIQMSQQRLERAEASLETTRKEHQVQIARLQSDNQLLASLHRENIDGLKVRHAQEMLALQNELDAAGMEAVRLQKLASQIHHHRTASPLVKGDPHVYREEVSFVERERGEGSEDGSSTSFSYRKTPSERDADSARSTRRMKPMPLDQLLDFNDLAEETEIITSSAPTSPTTVSLEQHNESLSMAEKRCRHLSTLLMESEANEARLSQLVDALKEEIRRNERSEERQKHIENLEYMKNVVLKFVTLPRGEERSRLVPVLTTILRLSPAEVQEVHQTLSRNEGAAVLPTAWGGVFNYFAPSS